MHGAVSVNSTPQTDSMFSVRLSYYEIKHIDETEHVYSRLCSDECDRKGHERYSKIPNDVPTKNQ
jgi:hypothetical protein